MSTLLQSYQVVVDGFEELIDLSLDGILFPRLCRPPLPYFGSDPGLSLCKLLVDCVDNLLAELLKVAVELLQCVVELLVLCLGHNCPLILKVALALVELLLAVAARSLVDLVFLIGLAELEPAGVDD